MLKIDPIKGFRIIGLLGQNWRIIGFACIILGFMGDSGIRPLNNDLKMIGLFNL